MPENKEELIERARERIEELQLDMDMIVLNMSILENLHKLVLSVTFFIVMGMMCFGIPGVRSMPELVWTAAPFLLGYAGFSVAEGGVYLFIRYRYRLQVKDCEFEMQMIKGFQKKRIDPDV